MDPDPFSLFPVLFSTPLFLVFSLFNVFVLLLIGLGLYLLFLISHTQLFLTTIDTEALEELEENDLISFKRLSFLYRNTNSISLSYAMAKGLLTTIVAYLLYFILSSVWVPFYLIFLIIFCVVAMVSWLLPIAFKQKGTFPKFGFWISNPLLTFCAGITNYIVPTKNQSSNNELSIEELKTALADNEKEVISTANLNLYKQIFRFDKLKVKQVMRPKSELQGIKSNYNFKEVLQKIDSSQFSRLPVYEGNWSKVLGIVHCKDLLPHTDKDRLNWKQYIRPILYVQEGDNAQQVLRQFQQSKNHMALVLNTGKRLAGLVTLEDITEEIIGEIEDE